MSLYLYPIFASKIFAVIIGLVNWRLLTKPYKLIAVQVCLILLTESLGLYLNHVRQCNNVFLFNIYNILEVWLLAYIGKQFITTKFARLILPILIFLTVYWFYCVLLRGIDEFFNWFFVVYCFFLVIIFTVILFTNALFNRKKVLGEPLFLICISIILYYGCTVPLFGVMNYLIKNDINTAARLFYISHTVEVLRYLLIAIAFYLYGRQAKRAYVA